MVPRYKIINYFFTTSKGIRGTARHFKLPKSPGVIGILSDYIQCDEKYRPIARFLFGNVILTKTGKDACKLSNAGYKAVSMDGEFFESKVSAMTIDIDSKISKLTKIISQSSTVEGLLETITLLRKLLQKKKQHLKKIEDKHITIKYRYAVLKKLFEINLLNNNFIIKLIG